MRIKQSGKVIGAMGALVILLSASLVVQASPAAGPENGSGVTLGQTVRWADENSTVSQVELRVAGQPVPRAVDFLVIQDVSTHMGRGDAGGAGECTQPDHIKTYTFTGPVDYYYTMKATGGGYIDVTSQITVTLTYHRDTLTGRTVTGYEAGKRFSNNSAGSSSGDGYRWSDWDSDVSAEKFLVAAFAGRSAEGNSGFTFPKSLEPGDASCAGDPMATAKSLLHTLVDIITAPTGASEAEPIKSGHRLQVIAFGDGAEELSPGGFCDGENLPQIRAGIDNLSAGGGANYTAALSTAVDAIESRGGAETNPVVVIFLSSGKTDRLPDRADIQALQGLAERGVYTVGLGELEPEGRKLLESIRGEPGTFTEAASGTEPFLKAMRAVASEMLPAGREAVVTSRTGESQFEPILPGDAEYADYPITVEVDGQAVRTLTEEDISAGEMFSFDGEKITWRPGDVPSMSAVLRYHVKAGADLEPGTYFPCGETTIHYMDSLSTPQKEYFPRPQLAFPGGTLQYVYYEVDGAGRPLGRDGETVLDNPAPASLLENGRVLRSGYLKAGDAIRLPAGDYRAETPEAYELENGRTYQRHGEKVFTANIGVGEGYFEGAVQETDGEFYAPTCPVRDNNDAWVVLVPYVRVFTLTYHPNGGDDGTNLPGTVSVSAGTEVALDTNVVPIRTDPFGLYNYTFSGWSTAAGEDNALGSIEKATLPQGETGDLTVYAIWEKTKKTTGVTVNYYEEGTQEGEKGVPLGSYPIENVPLGTALNDVVETHEVPFGYELAKQQAATGGIWSADKGADFEDVGTLLASSLSEVSAGETNTIDIAFPRRNAVFTVRYWLGNMDTSPIGRYQEQGKAGLPVSAYSPPTGFAEAMERAGSEIASSPNYHDEGSPREVFSGVAISPDGSTVVNIVFEVKRVAVQVRYYKDEVAGANLLGGYEIAGVEAGTRVQDAGAETSFARAKAMADSQTEGAEMPELGDNYHDTAEYAAPEATVDPGGEAVVQLVFPRKMAAVTVEYYEGGTDGEKLGSYICPSAPAGDRLETLGIPTGAQGAEAKCDGWLSPGAHYNPQGTVASPTGGLEAMVHPEDENLVQIVFPVYREDVTVRYFAGQAGVESIGGYTLTGVDAGTPLAGLDVALNEPEARQRSASWQDLSEFYEISGTINGDTSLQIVTHGEENRVDVVFTAKPLYTLSFSAGGGDVINLPAREQWYAGKELLSSGYGRDMRRANYAFTGWHMEAGDAVETGFNPAGGTGFTMPARDIVLTATWSRNVLKADILHAYAINGAQSGSESEPGLSIAAGSEVDICSAYARPRYLNYSYGVELARVTWQGLPGTPLEGESGSKDIPVGGKFTFADGYEYAVAFFYSRTLVLADGETDARPESGNGGTGAPAGGGTADTGNAETADGPRRGAPPPADASADRVDKPANIPGSAAAPATPVVPQTPASAAEEPATPGAQGREGTGWALLNLVLALLALSVSVVSTVQLVRRRMHKRQGGNSPLWWILAMAVGIMLPVLLFITGDVGPMTQIADPWTPLMAILLAAQLLLVIVSSKRRSPARRHQ